MILYTCGTKKMGPGFAHPCAKAGKALDAAGYEYELKTVGGYRMMPWTWGSREDDRAEIKKLSGHQRGADPRARRRRGHLRLRHDRPLGRGAPALRRQERRLTRLDGGDQRLARRAAGADHDRGAVAWARR